MTTMEYARAKSESISKAETVRSIYQYLVPTSFQFLEDHMLERK